MKKQSYQHIFLSGLALTLALCFSCAKDVDRAAGFEKTNEISGGFDSTATTAKPIVPVLPTPSDSSPTPIPTPNNPIICGGDEVKVVLRDQKRLGLWQSRTTEQVQVSATVVAKEDGIYEFYSAPWANGGATQINESFYTTISNNFNTNGYPLVDQSNNAPNCGKFHVAVDNDNNGPAPTSTYLGRFSLVKGDQNTLTVYHFCDLFLKSEGTVCPELHQGELQAPTSCLVCGGNNLEVIPSGVCVRKIPFGTDQGS